MGHGRDRAAIVGTIVDDNETRSSPAHTHSTILAIVKTNRRYAFFFDDGLDQSEREGESSTACPIYIPCGPAAVAEKPRFAIFPTASPYHPRSSTVPLYGRSGSLYLELKELDVELVADYRSNSSKQ